MDRLLKVHMTHSICAFVVVVNEAELSTHNNLLYECSGSVKVVGSFYQISDARFGDVCHVAV